MRSFFLLKMRGFIWIILLLMATIHYICIVPFLWSLGFVSLSPRSKWVSLISFRWPLRNFTPTLRDFFRCSSFAERAYSLLCTVRTFLHIFSVGTATNRSEQELLVTYGPLFRPTVILEFFSAFKDSFKGFKEDFIRIQVPARFLAFFSREDRAPLFPLYWDMEGASRKSSFYNTSVGSLSPNELTNVQFLSDCVGMFGLLSCREFFYLSGS